jgi:hypothetical protein
MACSGRSYESSAHHSLALLSDVEGHDVVAAGNEQALHALRRELELRYTEKSFVAVMGGWVGSTCFRSPYFSWYVPADLAVCYHGKAVALRGVSNSDGGGFFVLQFSAPSMVSIGVLLPKANACAHRAESQCERYHYRIWGEYQAKAAASSAFYN